MALTQQEKREAQRLAQRSFGITDNERRPYSLSRALLAVAEGKPLSGYEGEVSQQVSRANGIETRSQHSFFMPTSLALFQGRQKRDMTTGTPSAGGYLVGTDNLAGSFIDLLRPLLISRQLGATFMSGLKGNVTIPKLSASGSAYWLSNETTSITKSQPTLGQVPLSPKNCGCYTEFSRQLMMQSSPAIDALVANDLAATVAEGIDNAVINGTGTDGQPSGLLLWAGIGAFSGTTLGLAGLLEAQSDCANALDGNAIGYLTTPAVAAMLKQRHVVASTYSPLWDGNLLNGTVGGFRAMTSAKVPTATMIFGDWEQIVIGEWGVLEIASNPFANFQAGIVGVRAIQTVDVGVRNAGAFSVATSITY
jgi:HK97 family phage major capsid protein